MSNLPVFLKSIAFLKGVSLIVAGVAALLVYFKVIPPNYGFDAGIVLGVFYAILNFFNVKPELRARGLLKK